MNLRTPRDIGAAIRERRRELGLDQATLAQLAGVSRLWINEIERGKPGATLSRVLRTFAALGVSLAIAGKTNMPPPEDQPAVVTPDINAIVSAAKRQAKP